MIDEGLMLKQAYEQGRADATKWHYPSRGEYPKDDEEVLVIAESDHSRYKSLETYYPEENEWSTVWKIIAWQYIEPPKEEV